ncbi:MAG: DUF4387 domain-containing protein [Rhodospirillales bacterium]
MTRLNELASTIRSKNAGVNQVTFDIIFPDRESYDRVIRGGSITRNSMARLFNIPEERISDFVNFDVGNAIKFTIYRSRPNGSPGDWDVLGCQQYGPLTHFDVP